MTEKENTADSNQKPADETAKASSTLSRFIDHLANHKLAPAIKITSYGLFISQSLFPGLIAEFRIWLKADSGAAGLLAENRCTEILFSTANPLSYYILDGRNCEIGYLIQLDRPAPNKSHFTHYAGTPLDGRKSIHPKDPILNNLPAGLKLNPGQSGFDMYFEKDNFRLTFPVARISEILTLFYHSPRLRKYKKGLSGAIRDILPLFSKLINSGRMLDRSKIHLLPAEVRKERSVRFFRISDIVLVLNEKGGFSFGYGLKGKNLYDFVSFELKELSRTVRSRRIGSFELNSRDRHSVGSMYCNKEKFIVDLKALLDWIQIYKLRSDSSHTLFDYILALGDEFSESGWTIERDIPNRYRARQPAVSRDRRHNKPHINYRTARKFLFWIGNTSNLIAARRYIRHKPHSVALIIKN